MKRLLKFNTNKALALALAFVGFGFYFQGVTSELMGVQSSIFSYIYRSLVLLVSIVFVGIYIAKGVTLNKNVIHYLIAFLILCALYIFAIAKGEVVTFFNHVADIRLVMFMLLFGCVIPALLFSLVNNANIKTFSIFAFCLLLLTLIFSIVVYLRYLEAGIIFSTRLSTERINPISLGHVCVSIIIISYCALTSFAKKYSFHYFMFALGSILACVALLITMSRGALMSLVIVIMFIGATRASLSKIVFYGALLIVVVISGFYAAQIATGLDLDVIIGSYMNIGSSSDQSAQIRFGAYFGAWEQFSNHYFFGDVIEERTTNFYPHNLILEVLMSTGILGGLILILILLPIGIKILTSNKSVQQNLFVLLFLQYLIGSMFSGSFYSNIQLWCFLFAAAVIIYNQSNRVKVNVV